MASLRSGDYEPNRRIEFSSLNGPMPYKWDLELEAVDGVTVLTSHVERSHGVCSRLPKR